MKLINKIALKLISWYEWYIKTDLEKELEQRAETKKLGLSLNYKRNIK